MTSYRWPSITETVPLAMLVTYAMTSSCPRLRASWMATHQGSFPTLISATLGYASFDTSKRETESRSGLTLQMKRSSLVRAIGLECVGAASFFGGSFRSGSGSSDVPLLPLHPAARTTTHHTQPRFVCMLLLTIGGHVQVASGAGARIEQRKQMSHLQGSTTLVVCWSSGGETERAVRIPGDWRRAETERSRPTGVRRAEPVPPQHASAASVRDSECRPGKPARLPGPSARRSPRWAGSCR